MSSEKYSALLNKIFKEGLDTYSAVEVMAWHNQTGTPVKQLCGLPEKIVLQRLIESYLSIRAERDELRAKTSEIYVGAGHPSNVPVSIGDEVYVIASYCFRCKNDKGFICHCENEKKFTVLPMTVRSLRDGGCAGYVISDNSANDYNPSFIYCAENDFGKDWFTDRFSAEQKVIELEKENQ